jgi:hypothetical protein
MCRGYTVEMAVVWVDERGVHRPNVIAPPGPTPSYMRMRSSGSMRSFPVKSRAVVYEASV